MSALDLIGTFGVTVTVTRTAAGVYAKGEYAPGATSTLTTTMSVQPMSGRELLNLPEAQRTRQWVRGYCPIELRTADQSGSLKADLVAYAGKSYEVQKVEYWQSTASDIAPHWKVEMAEVNP